MDESERRDKMGLEKAIAALGILIILIGGMWIKNNGVGAIGLLLVIVSPFVGLIMTSIKKKQTRGSKNL
jgi:hypothetical protein